MTNPKSTEWEKARDEAELKLVELELVDDSYPFVNHFRTGAEWGRAYGRKELIFESSGEIMQYHAEIGRLKEQLAIAVGALENIGAPGPTPEKYAEPGDFIYAVGRVGIDRAGVARTALQKIRGDKE